MPCLSLRRVRGIRSSRVLAAFVFLLAAAAGAAEEPWLGEPFAADAATLRAAALALAAPADAGVLVLVEDGSYSFDADGRMTSRHRFVYRVLTQDGAGAWADASATWDPWHQDRPEVRARVVGADGVERWLDAATLVEEPVTTGSYDVYSDRRRLRAPLPAMAPGAVVEEQVVVRDREPFFAAGTAWVHYLTSFQPARHLRLTLDAPTSLPLRYGTRLLPGLEPERTVAGDRVRLVFARADVPAAEMPARGLPPWEPRFPHVAFSTAASWNDVAAAYSRLVDERIAGSDLAALAEPPPAGASVAERAQEYLRRIHDVVRYTGLELGQASIVPATPAEVLARRYGDCKDQASLLVALLRGEGVPAYVALLSAGFDHDVDTQLPGLGRFDHAIVHVPGASPIWIDPTDPDTPAGELPLSDQGRWALVASPNTRELVRIPAAPSVANRDLETREVFLPELGAARVVERSEYHGVFASERRAYHRATTQDARLEDYREYVAAEYESEELGEVEEGDARATEAPFHLRLEARDVGPALTALDDAAVGIDVQDLLGSLPPGLPPEEDAPPRETSFHFDRPYVAERHYVVHSPPGLVPRKLPEDIERDLGGATYAARYWEADDGTVHALLRFDTGPRLVAAEDFQALADGVAELAESDRILLFFDDPGKLHLDAGRPREAVDHYRTLVAREPERAVHRIRFARALLALGLGMEARREAATAARLAEATPAILPTAHWIHGHVLQHDEIGRLREGDWDRAGALAAFDRALASPHDASSARLEKAILLEHDARGRRYHGEGVDLAGAIELYRKWLEENASAGIRVNLALALYHAGRYDEVLKEREAAGAPEVQAILLASRVLVDGVEAAEDELRKLGLATAEAQAPALAMAAQSLVLKRRYPEAAALVRQAANRSPNPGPLLTFAGVLERTRREEDPADEPAALPDTPEEVTRRFVLAISATDRDEDALDLMHSSVRAATRQQLRDLEAAALFDRVLPGMDPGLVLDLASATLATSVEGDAEVGYRVRLTSVLAPQLDVAYYLTDEGGEPRIVTGGRDRAGMADEVLRRLAEGDGRGARQWLDWARRGWKPISSADDPMVLSPFHTLWPEPSPEAGPERLELVARVLRLVALAAAEGTRDDGERSRSGDLAADVAAARAALEPTTEPAERRALGMALLRGLDALDRVEERDALLARLLEWEPASATLRARRYEALLATGKLANAETALRADAKRYPRDGWARYLLANVMAQQGSFDEATAILEELQESGDGFGMEVNDVAWFGLFREPVDVTGTVALAEEAAKEVQYGNRGVLHTLATVYAWAERPHDAYRVLLQSIAVTDADDALAGPQPFDWLVLGRIAESYGFPDLAADCYRRVEAPDDEEDALGSHVLAQRRLAALDIERNAEANGRRGRR